MGQTIIYCGFGLFGAALLLLIVFAFRRLRYDASKMAKTDADELEVEIPGQEDKVQLQNAPKVIKVKPEGIDYEDGSEDWEDEARENKVDDLPVTKKKRKPDRKHIETEAETGEAETAAETVPEETGDADVVDLPEATEVADVIEAETAEESAEEASENAEAKPTEDPADELVEAAVQVLQEEAPAEDIPVDILPKEGMEEERNDGSTDPALKEGVVSE